MPVEHTIDNNQRNSIQYESLNSNSFFDREPRVVAQELSEIYRVDGEEELRVGTSKFLGLQTNMGIVWTQVVEVVAYSDEYTRNRWSGRDSRASTIYQLRPGEVIGYDFRGRTMLFIKTQNAATINLFRLRQVDQGGQPIKDELLRSNKPAEMIGLDHGEIGTMQAAQFGAEEAFILTSGQWDLDDSQLDALEQSILP